MVVKKLYELTYPKVIYTPTAKKMKDIYGLWS